MTLNKYRLYCNTEAANVETDYKEAVPTVCPHNNAHTIDTDSITIIATQTDEDPRDPTGKLRTQETSRPLGLDTYFTGAGDDPANISTIGGDGQRFIIDHAISGDNPNVVYLDFNIAPNETWVHEGYFGCKNAVLDYFNAEVVPIVTTKQAGTGTDYSVYGGYLIVPAATPGMGEGAGQGTCDITADLTTPRGGLIYVPNSDEGYEPGYSGHTSAFWNADWNATSKEFENITAAVDGKGRYNMFSVAVTLKRFVNKWNLLGEMFLMMQSADTARMGQGMRFKFSAYTYGTDHAWQMIGNITMHRKKTTS